MSQILQVYYQHWGRDSNQEKKRIFRQKCAFRFQKVIKQTKWSFYSKYRQHLEPNMDQEDLFAFLEMLSFDMLNTKKFCLFEKESNSLEPFDWIDDQFERTEETSDLYVLPCELRFWKHTLQYENKILPWMLPYAGIPKTSKEIRRVDAILALF